MLTCAAAAVQSLRRKRLYEQQIEQLGNFQLRIHDYSTWYFLIKKVISATSTKALSTYNSILMILTFCKNIVK